MKESYIEYVILEYMMDGNFDAHFDGWIDSEDLSAIQQKTAFDAFAEYGIRVDGKYEDQVQGLFKRLVADNGIATRGDEYAGYWYRLNVPHKNAILKTRWNNNTAVKTLAALPDDALGRALNRIVVEDDLTELHGDDSGHETEPKRQDHDLIAPASDRIVKLSHNQKDEIEKPLDELIEEIAVENAIDGDPSFLQLIKGQLKAGRELIREGCFKIYVLEATLIEALNRLVEKYKDHAIGAAASKLLDLIVEAIKNA